MMQFGITVLVSIGIMIVFILLGGYFRKNINAANEIRQGFLAIHDAIGYLSTGFLFLAVILIYIAEIQNVGPYLHDHLNIPNGYSILIVFAFVSVVCISAALLTIHGFTQDGELSMSEIITCVFLVLAAAGCEYIFYLYGQKVHVGYYESNIAILTKQFNELRDPAFVAKLQLTAEEQKVLLNKIYNKLSFLQQNVWSGKQRMIILLCQVALNVFCIIASTFGFAKQSLANAKKELNKDEKENEDDKQSGKTSDEEDEEDPLNKTPFQVL